MSVRLQAELEAEKSSRSAPRWVTHAALLVVQFAFASQAVEAKLAMLPRAAGGEGIAPEALAMVRMAAAALVLQLLIRLRRRRALPIGGADHARLAGLSLLGISINQALFLAGLRWTTPFSTALLGATIPVFAAGLAVVCRKESFSARTAAGVALAFCGVVSLIGVGEVDRGAVLVSLNSVSYAAYVVFSCDVVLRVGALRAVAWLFTYGAASFAALGAAPLVATVPSLTARGWVLVLYIVAVPTIVAYLLNAWALARSSATLVTIYIYLQPLLAAVLARIQLGLGIASRAWIAAVLILVGLGVVSFRHRAGEPSAPS